MKDIIPALKVKLKFDISPVRSVELECQVDWAEKDRMALLYPENKPEFVQYLPEGQELNVSIYTNRGIRVFDSIVLNSPLEEEFIIEYYPESDDELSIQRREYVRIPMSIDALILKQNASKAFKTTTLEVGGGGIRFIVKEKFKIGESVRFNLHPPGKEYTIKGQGEIVKIVERDSFTYGIMKFTNISEADRSKVMKLCFETEALRIRQLK